MEEWVGSGQHRVRNPGRQSEVLSQEENMELKSGIRLMVSYENRTNMLRRLKWSTEKSYLEPVTVYSYHQRRDNVPISRSIFHP
jgi:hypothetical protein